MIFLRGWRFNGFSMEKKNGVDFSMVFSMEKIIGGDFSFGVSMTLVSAIYQRQFRFTIFSISKRRLVCVYFNLLDVRFRP